MKQDDRLVDWLTIIANEETRQNPGKGQLDCIVNGNLAPGCSEVAEESLPFFALRAQESSRQPYAIDAMVRARESSYKAQRSVDLPRFFLLPYRCRF